MPGNPRRAASLLNTAILDPEAMPGPPPTIRHRSHADGKRPEAKKATPKGVA